MNDAPFFKALALLVPAKKKLRLTKEERAAERKVRQARIAAHAERVAREEAAIPRRRAWADSKGGVETRQIVLAMACGRALKVKTIAKRTGLPERDVRDLLFSGRGRWFLQMGRARFRLVRDWQQRLFGDELFG
jgi:hypothetical protein